MSTNTTEQVLAAVTAAVCVALLVRLCLGARLRWRLDHALRRAGGCVHRAARSVYGWRSSRKRAAREAEEAIARARHGGDWQGNVYTPKSFKRPKRPH